MKLELKKGEKVIHVMKHTFRNSENNVLVKL